ncbi:MAG: hypothetical protein KGL39_10840 [Patescibacteria group bacterium]|nr:hypothetical protein [Patescibacteria group bacterium]
MCSAAAECRCNCDKNGYIGASGKLWRLCGPCHANARFNYLALLVDKLEKKLDAQSKMLKTIIDLLDRRDALAGMQSLEESLPSKS